MSNDENEITSEMTARERAVRAVWHRYVPGWRLDAFRHAMAHGCVPVLVPLMKVVDSLEVEIAEGRAPFCSVCETLHPPLGGGQVLLLPSDPREADRVMQAHVRDEVRRAGANGIAFSEMRARILGDPS